MALLEIVLLFIVAIEGAIKISEDEIYELTPFGYWLSDCFHSVRAGAHIDNYDDHFTVDGVKVKRCHTKRNSTYINERISSYLLNKNGNKVSAVGNGWQVYVKMDAGKYVNMFNGNWAVPPTPVKMSSDEVLYTFTGLQNIDWVPPEKQPDQPFDIIQPVLQYGFESGKGGGQFWGISSWYVTLSNDVMQSTLKRTSPGDLIYGVMNKTHNDTWFINAKDESLNVNTSLTVTRSILSSQPWVYITLEVYNIDDCDNEYPSTGSQIPYSNLLLQERGVPTTLHFDIGTNGQSPPVCNPKIRIDNSAHVTIVF